MCSHFWGQCHRSWIQTSLKICKPSEQKAVKYLNMMGVFLIHNSNIVGLLLRVQPLSIKRTAPLI